MDKLKTSGRTDIPMNKRAYVLYHMAKQEKYDPELVGNLEMGIGEKAEASSVQGAREGETHLTGRHAMAAVYAYWVMNTGSAAALKYWERHLIKMGDDLHIQDVVELCRGFRENRTHHRDHLRGMITKHLKKNMLEYCWPNEADFHQRNLINLMTEFEHLEYWDKDIWRRIFDSVGKQKRIQNLHFFAQFHRMMRQLNEDPKSPLF
jgi:hypothetical protein